MTPTELLVTTLLMFGLAGWLSFSAMFMAARMQRSVALYWEREVKHLRTGPEQRLAAKRASLAEQTPPPGWGGVSRWPETQRVKTTAREVVR